MLMKCVRLIATAREGDLLDDFWKSVVAHDECLETLNSEKRLGYSLEIGFGCRL